MGVLIALGAFVFTFKFGVGVVVGAAIGAPVLLKWFGYAKQEVAAIAKKL